MPTVGADVRFGIGGGLEYSEVEKRAKASLARVGLEHLYDRPVASLSGGQKQRVAIAGVLAQVCNNDYLESMPLLMYLAHAS